MIRRTRIELQAAMTEVSRLNEWLDIAISGIRSGHRCAQDLKLCINEAVANVISYGFIGVDRPRISVEIALSAQSASAVIEDNGRYFDIRTYPDPPKPTDLESISIGGFGIPLIKDRASEIDYERVGDRNRLRLVCRMPVS